MPMHEFKVIETDNWGSDYPDEKELCWVNADGRVLRIAMTREEAQKVSSLMCEIFHGNSLQHPRHIMPEHVSKILQGPFEP